ncbi:MAG TPA: GNAT family N-acetyltransferase [Pyrinomonadaceae bacterium]
MENHPAESSHAGDERVALRPVTPEDETFLFEVYKSTRRAERALVSHWDDAYWDSFMQMQFNAQRHDYRTRCPESEHSIVLFEGRPAGRIWVDRNERGVHLLDITVLPEFQNRGIGTTLLRRLSEECDREGKPLTDYVDKGNERAMRLYERLGFRVKEEIPTHFKMERPPRA